MSFVLCGQIDLRHPNIRELHRMNSAPQRSARGGPARNSREGSKNATCAVISSKYLRYWDESAPLASKYQPLALTIACVIVRAVFYIDMSGKMS